MQMTSHSVRLLPCSHIRECLKLDQDDKECFSHYKQVKKLSKQLDSAEELIQEGRSVHLSRGCTSVPSACEKSASLKWN